MEYQKSFKMKKKLPCMRLLKMDTVLNKYQKNIFYVWKLKQKSWISSRKEETVTVKSVIMGR